jgi:hypothetical protein
MTNPPASEFAPPLQQSAPVSEAYLLFINGQQSGPYTIPQMRSMWQNGSINSGTGYWQTGMPQWQSLANIRHFLDMPSTNQFGAPVIQNQVSYQVGYPIQQMLSPKSRVAFILLGLFLGCLGIHNFYAGIREGRCSATDNAIPRMAIWPRHHITGIWALVEIIAVSKDAQLPNVLMNSSSAPTRSNNKPTCVA